MGAVQQEIAAYIRAGTVRAARYVPLRLPNGAPVFDISSAQDARAVLRTIHDEVLRLRQPGYIIHFSAAGGRKGMTMYAMAFDPKWQGLLTMIVVDGLGNNGRSRTHPSYRKSVGCLCDCASLAQPRGYATSPGTR